jgi:hypothetical protein
MRPRLFIFGMMLLACGRDAGAQTPAAPVPAAPAPWTISGSAYTYVLPDEANYVQPTVVVTRRRLHLEGRFNYEDRNTGSVWAGLAFSGGDTVAWEVTPMFGWVFGRTDGVAPGYKGSIGWRGLEFYSEGEVLFDAGESADSYFYNWSELTFAPLDWFRFGLVTQRTRVYQQEREVQRGLLAGFSYRALDVAAYLFNPDDSKPILVVSVGVSFPP